MAKIDTLEAASRERPGKHRPVSATYHVFEADGETILQIDTYGSLERQTPGKITQSIQFGSEGLRSLRAILDDLGA